MAELTIAIRAQNQAQAVLNQLKGGLGDIQRQAESASTQLKNMGSSLTGIGTKMSVGVTAPILGFAAAAVKAAADNEQLEVAFTTMLGSAEKAKTMMAELSQFAASTPFETPEIQNASKMLLAFGVSAEEIIPTMTNLGDIAAGLNIPLGDMAYLFGTTRASGRLMTADLNQFTSRGIPMISALAKTMGIAEKDVKGFVEAGKVGFPEVQAALNSLTAEGGQFSGLMEAQSKTLGGLFSTFSDTIGLTLTEIGKQIIDTFDLKTKLADALVWMDRMKNAILDFAKTNPEMFRLGIIIAAVAAAIGPLLVGVGMLAGWIGAALPVITALGGALGLLISPIGLVAAGIAAIIAFDVGGIRTGIVAAFQGLQTVLYNLGQYFRWVIVDVDSFNDYLRNLPAWLQPVAEAMGRFIADAIVAFGEFQTVLHNLGQYFRWVVEDADFFNDYLRNLPAWLQPAAEALGRLTAGFITFINGTDFSKFKSDVTGAFQDVWTAVKSFFSGDLDLSGLATVISDSFAKIRQAVIDLFGGTDFAQFLETIQWSEFIEKLTWENFISVLDDWATWITDVVWGDYLQPLAWDAWLTLLDWAEYVEKLAWDVWLVAVDWATWIAPLVWGTVVTTLTDWGQWITSLDWTKIVTTVIDWATWIPALTWTAFVTVIEWGAYIASLAWDGFVGLVNWADYILSLDWSTPVPSITWSDFVAALDWVGYIAAFAWESFVEKLTWTGVVAKLETWSTYIPKLTWGSVVTAMTNWGDYIVALDWTTIITTAIDWATWIPALVWNGFVAILDWGIYIASLPWGDWISKLSWSERVKTLTWSDFVTALTSWGTWVASLDWAGFITKLADWGAFVGSFAWSSFVSKLNWPNLSINWSQFIPKLSWPNLSIDWGDYIPDFPGWGALWEGVTSVLPGNAVGTSNWRGGMTWVGESGPEIVALPRGSRIFSNSESQELAFASAASPQIVIQQMVVRSEEDIYSISYQLDDIKRRHQSRRRR